MQITAAYSGVFISYRRDEDPGLAGRIRDRVADRFPGHPVFYDVESIEPGLDFTGVIDEAIKKSKIMLVIIGKNWLVGRSENGRDYITYEVASAFARQIRVVPVLINGASPPQPTQLPLSIRSLPKLHYVEVSHATFQSDLTAVLDAIDRVINSDRKG